MTIAAVVGLTVWQPEQPPRPDVRELSPGLAELFAMDEILGRATVLLDAENREVLLNLHVEPQPRI